MVVLWLSTVMKIGNFVNMNVNGLFLGRLKIFCSVIVIERFNVLFKKRKWEM